MICLFGWLARYRGPRAGLYLSVRLPEDGVAAGHAARTRRAGSPSAHIQPMDPHSGPTRSTRTCITYYIHTYFIFSVSSHQLVDVL